MIKWNDSCLKTVMVLSFIMGFSILLVGCTSTDYENEQSRREEEIEALIEENEEISASIESLLGEMETLNLSIDSLNDDVELLNFNLESLEEKNEELELFVDELVMNDNQNLTIMDTSNSGYVVTWTEIGSLLVSVESIEPYLSGYKLELAIGNPSAATYNGLELKLTCMADYMEKNPIIKNISIANLIEPGSWSSVEIIVDDVEEENISYLQFDFESDNIMLYE